VPLAAAAAEQGAPARHAELVQRVMERGRPWVADIRSDPSGLRLFEIAIPMPHAAFAGRVPVLVAAAEAERSLQGVLGGWEDVGPTAFAYLVRLQAQRVRYLTSPEPDRATASAPVDIGEPEARPAAMAATGIETSVEQSDRGRAPYFAVTRFLAEPRWGIVGRADRSVLMAGMRGTVWKLLLLDLAILLGAGLLIWQWQRGYARALAKHEMRVTQWHAERVQAILDTAFDAIVTFDRTGRVRSVNRAAEALFGRPAAGMEGHPLHRILRWTGAQGEAKERELPTPGVAWVANALRPDGHAVPTEMSIGQSGGGDDLLFTAIVRDVRERVEAEKRIRAFADGLEASNRRLEELNAQLEEASRLKSEFLANTSHELRTPLNGVMGFLQLVLDGMCRSKEEEQGFLRQALQCSRHLLNLINDVLDIARIEAGKLALDIQRVPVSTLFQEVRTLTHVQAAQKGLQLDFLEPDDRTCAVRCDLGKAKQVLINLVGNSLKFTSKGSITIRAFPRPDLGHVMFEVEDTGIGIAREQQAVIFEKFAQGDGSTTRKYGGAGLGLAISRSLVELMGGVIGVASEGPGKGTRMYFSLPVWNERAEAALPADDGVSDQIDGPAGGPLVLIVEDDPVFRKFLTAVLHQRGYRTVEVPSAEAGWVRVRRLQPAIVVVDYALSCSEGAALRTGWDLAQRMTGDAETRHIPVLFVTGFESQVREKLQHTSFARKPQHLVKPIDPAALVGKIQEMTSAVSARGQVRILMAEDDPTVTAFVRKVLPEGRYHLEVAENGEECLHILRTQPHGFDLLLLDLMMPRVSGYDVLRDMTLSGTAARLPVLVLTNCPEPESQEEKRLLEEGLVVEVVAKSSIHGDPRLLADVIERHLDSARQDQAGGEVEAA
jgi:PAS domain S-box-containing protein